MGILSIGCSVVLFLLSFQLLNSIVLRDKASLVLCVLFWGLKLYGQNQKGSDMGKDI